MSLVNALADHAFRFALMIAAWALALNAFRLVWNARSTARGLAWFLAFLLTFGLAVAITPPVVLDLAHAIGRWLG